LATLSAQGGRKNVGPTRAYSCCVQNSLLAELTSMTPVKLGFTSGGYKNLIRSNFCNNVDTLV